MIRWIWASVVVALMVLEICFSAMTAAGQTAAADAFDQVSPGLPALASIVDLRRAS